MPLDSKINDRIRQLRKKLGLTQVQFAQKIGYKQGRISGIEKPETSISDKLIKLICIRTWAREDWIRTGEGEMFDEPSGLLLMAKRILESNTHYAESLAANIKSFSMGLDLELNIKHCGVATVAEGRTIRANDPIEKKEEILKLRTM